MRALGVIPARGGSKGISRKNLVDLCGRPLLAYTADASLQSDRLTRVIVSTDDEEIAEAARRLGLDVPFLRPSLLAADETPMLPVVRHALAAVAEPGGEFDAVVLLQPTSPLRTAAHIDAALEILDRTGADSVVSVVEVPHQFHPVSVMRLEGDQLRPFLDRPTVTRRQEKPRLLARNGPAVLAVRAAVVEAGSLYGHDSRPLVMGPEESLDIDTPWDLSVAALLINARAGRRQ